MGLNIEKRLDLYVAKVDELERCKFVSSSSFRNLSCNIKGQDLDVSPHFTITITEPPEDEFKSYLMTLRHFIADKEPTQFGAVANQIARERGGTCLNSCAIRLNEDFKRICKETTFQLSMGEASVSGQDVRNLFLNGQYFHSDINKIEIIESLRGKPEYLLLRYLFIVIARDLYVPVLNLGIAVRHRHDEEFLTRFCRELS